MIACLEMGLICVTLLQGQAKQVEKNAEPTAKDAAKNIKDVAQKVQLFQGIC